MFLFLTVLQAIVAAALVGVVLMQRSEGGGLGIGGGGGPGGILSVRGAANMLTRATAWLAVVFVGLSIVLAAMAVESGSAGKIDTSLDRTVAPAQTVPADPLAVPAGTAPAGATAAPAPATTAPADPLSGAAE